jgi:Na+/H+-dicarboxylate symporter
VFGIAIAIVGDEAQPVLSFFTSITVIMMRITQWIIALAPVGVLFLVSIRKFNIFKKYEIQIHTIVNSRKFLAFKKG